MDSGTLLAGRYCIDAPLASGGMGVVYSARQMPLGRAVAVKVLKRELLNHGPFLARLRREAYTASALKHPNIVEVTDLVLEEELAFLVMELLEGESLGSLIGRATQLSSAAVVSVARQVLAALQAAHAAGLVHRDVKPDNIFLVHRPNGNDAVKLLDFGLVKVVEPSELSRLTATNAILGTWQYMAPEQARGEEADPRADVYALGAVLYYALTKKRPYQAADMEASMFALSSHRAPPLRDLRPDVAPELAAVIERALEKDIHRRWQSAREMLEALPPLDDDEGLPETADPKPRPALDSELETLPVAPRRERAGDAERETKDAPLLHYRDAYASTIDVLHDAIELPTSDLASEIESVELRSIPPGRPWAPPPKVRVPPLAEWSDEEAERQRKRARTRFKRLALVFCGLFVFAAGIALGELLFR
jgi:serine/threonine-protein kinase